MASMPSITDAVHTSSYNSPATELPTVVTETIRAEGGTACGSDGVVKEYVNRLPKCSKVFIKYLISCYYTIITYSEQ